MKKKAIDFILGARKLGQSPFDALRAFEKSLGESFSSNDWWDVLWDAAMEWSGISSEKFIPFCDAGEGI